MLAALIAILGAIGYYLVFLRPTTEQYQVDIDSAPVESPKITKGKELFAANCASCHNKNMVDNLTGPALRGVESRWGAYPKEDLYNFIRHSQAMISKGHPRAVALWKEHQPTIMNDFAGLSDEDIKNLLVYINR